MLATWGTSTGFNPASLFAAGEQGAWYDPSDNTTMFQDSAGTTPVTAVEQAVGAILDERSPAYSVFFDGSGDFLTAPASANFSFDADFTIECWVNTSTSTVDSQFRRIIATGHDSATALQLVFRSGGVASSNVSLFSNVELISGTIPVADGAWHHLAVARSGSSIKLFVDGVQSGSTATSSTNFSDGATVGAFIGKATGAGTAGHFLGNISNVRIVKGTAVYTGDFTPPTAPLTAISGTSLLTCGTSWSGNPAITRNGDARVNGLNPFGSSVGNHAYQSTSASRPTLRARYNLLTYSEDFSFSGGPDQIWTQVDNSVATNTIVAPDGTTTADTFIENSGTSPHGVYGLVNAVASRAQRLTLSVYAKAKERSQVLLRMWSGGGGIAGGNGVGAIFDLIALTVTPSANGSGWNYVSGTLQDVGNGWYRCVVTVDLPSYGFPYFVITMGNAGSFSYAGDGTSGIYIWGAQLTQTAVFPSNTYQRIAAATNYDTGAAFPQYLSFDGTDDGLLTASVDFSGTDKMTVWGGLSKLSDDTDRTFVELSSVVNTNNGSFGLFAPSSISGGYVGRYAGSLRGTTQSVSQLTSYPAPITNVISAQYDIAGATIATESVYRINATTPSETTNGVTAGTGNFGNYPLFIGRRNNASLPLNGRIYSLIVRGAASNTTQVAQTERYVASKTPLGVVP